MAGILRCLGEYEIFNHLISLPNPVYLDIEVIYLDQIQIGTPVQATYASKNTN